MAALLHDIGKIPCTRREDGDWVSPNHTGTGARMTRRLLWETYGLCGTREAQNFRETICLLIRYHSMPPHLFETENPERCLLMIASSNELAPDFSLELLCLLSEADMRGRLCDSIQASWEAVRFCAEMAAETGCLMGPFDFPPPFSLRAYLSGRKLHAGQELYDDTWGEVTLLSGLPGTGKDTWIQAHGDGLPVISLDELRRRMGVAPTEKQGRVAEAARELAREYLRKKQPFLWNATSLTPALRQKQISLFESYGASVRAVFLDTGWEEGLRRNQNRPERVPEPVILHMLDNLTPPERFEAQRVGWDCM